ncbi:zeta toxin family protein [Solibacillus sp. FSL W7-1436]|uniref:zeta toxin family protein n=1 Tax=Solibacillus sp. FSL W7-1436 TaxID=2921705 RepID=UPI0030F54D4A
MANNFYEMYLKMKGYYGSKWMESEHLKIFLENKISKDIPRNVLNDINLSLFFEREHTNLERLYRTLVTVKEPFDTKEAYSNGIEGYNADRLNLHRKIIDKYTSEQRVAILLGGGSGAGKSSAIQKFVLPVFLSSFILIDSDDIKEQIPEYQLFKKMEVIDASDYVHEESSDLSKTLINYSIDNKRSFIYDGTMSKYDKYNDLIDRLKQTEYEIHILFVDTDVEIAQERVAERFLSEDGEIGRFVDPEIVIKTNQESAETFFKLYKSVNGFTLINNNDTPLIIATKEEIKEPKMFELFKKKGKY